MLIAPAIDVRGGRVVRLIQGDAARETVYEQDPAAVARRFAAAGARRIHLVDLDGAIDARPQPEAVAAVVAAATVPVEVGGGIRDLDTAARYVDGGAERVIFGTAAVAEPAVVAAACARWPGRVAVAVDVKDGRIAVRGWTEQSALEPLAFARRLRELGVTRVQYTDVSRDGTFTGPNLPATERIARESGLRVTVAGGIARLDDLRALRALEPHGVDEAVVGKALYEGRFTIPEANEAAGC
ncbi:MAG: 1-(5-phosphoribosyl)-5-[(5-phosphoribosylamino)methylideneamino]imidazole-4-carboxamide isomerase [Vicinamibacteria bacterium]|nr:1-(5-phosphoribosyl)-5-[(5-phosphoribosylamino)methylideneamino]imidazole-4-carboxamide isomerase [Vicinamibacteria bacterium]